MDTYDKAAAAHTEARTAEQSALSNSTSGQASEGVDWGKIVGLLTSERAVDTLLWQVLGCLIWIDSTKVACVVLCL